MHAPNDVARVEVTVLRVQPVGKGRLLALASVELSIDGVALTLHGLQVLQLRHAGTGAPATAVDLPRYCAADGRRQPALWASASSAPRRCWFRPDDRRPRRRDVRQRDDLDARARLLGRRHDGFPMSLPFTDMAVALPGVSRHPFQKIPAAIQNSLSGISSELVIVAATKAIALSDIDDGLASHHGIRLLQGNFGVKPSVQKQSRTSRIGLDKRRRRRVLMDEKQR